MDLKKLLTYFARNPWKIVISRDNLAIIVYMINKYISRKAL